MFSVGSRPRRVHHVRELRRERDRERQRSGWHEDVGDVADDACDGRPLPGDADRLDLERAIAALAPGYREVLVLHDVEGYTHEEIAASLGITAGGSKSQLFKARAKLRRLLAHLVDHPLAGTDKEHVAPLA